jgi:DNA sulfur modification protein DndD
MAMYLDSIKFENYRQYGTGAISFKKSTKASTQLFAFVAQNGTGKTTLLKAVIWCLYGEENPASVNYSYSKSHILPLANLHILENARNGDKIPVSVSLRFIEDRNIIEFIRTMSYKKNDTRYIDSASKFTVIFTPNGTGNSQVYKDEEADVFVKKYFDKAIYNYYFFDGEKLADFFDTPLKDSIYNIAQVNLLANTIKHIESYKNEILRKMEKDLPDIEEIREKKEEKDNLVKALDNERHKVQEDYNQASRDVTKFSAELKGYEDVKSLQEKREKLIQEQKDIEKEVVSAKSRQIQFIDKYLVYLNLYPRVKTLYNYIITKKGEGKLPPAIDRTQVLELLRTPDDKETNCPVCGAHIGPEERKHLAALLSQLEISSKTAAFFSQLIYPLSEIVQETHNYQKERDIVKNDLKTWSEKQRENQQKLDEVNVAFSNYGGEAGTRRVSNLNEQYEKALETKGACREKQAYLTKLHDEAVKKSEEYGEELDKLGKESNARQDLKDKFEVLSKLDDAFKNVKQIIVNKTKTEMEDLTWKYFNAMIWKSNTFGKIKIDDNYNVTVFNKNGQDMTKSASATEAMALAYSFTLAVHHVSGKNCPLIIDSPLGRVSDENRKLMAKALLDVAKDKQIIMLFTPDEYSKDVSELYDSAATVRRLNLTKDEAFVEGVEQYGR